jgi:hypothetical protein
MGTLDINWRTITPEQLLEITRSLSVSAGFGACAFFQGNKAHPLPGIGRGKATSARRLHRARCPASYATTTRLFRARSVALFSWPQAAMISSPRGVRIGLA